MERLTMYMLVMLCICLLASTATNTSKFPLTPTWWGLVLQGPIVILFCYDYQELCSCYNHYHCCNHDFRVHQENCEIGHAENELNNRLKDQNLFRLTRPVIILVMVIIFVIVVIIKQSVIILVISFLSLSFLLS